MNIARGVLLLDRWTGYRFQVRVLVSKGGKGTYKTRGFHTEQEATAWAAECAARKQEKEIAMRDSRR